MSIQINVPDHILFEDAYVLVMNKPAGLMVEPDRNGHPNLLQQVKRYRKDTTTEGIEAYAQHLHRLDRPVSGIVLFAKQKAVLRNLSEQFAQRHVKKYYQALTEAIPDRVEGTLESWHKKEKKKALLFAENTPGTQLAVLQYRVHKLSETRYFWNIELHTGKYHQIRAQLSAVGCPIIGDHLYGSTNLYLPNSIALHAAKLEFLHPITNQSITIESNSDFIPNSDEAGLLIRHSN